MFEMAGAGGGALKDLTITAPPPTLTIPKTMRCLFRSTAPGTFLGLHRSERLLGRHDGPKRMVLAAPDHLLVQYRGNIFIPAELAVAINRNSTLRTLSVEGNGEEHTLFLHFGNQGTGVD